VLVRQAAVGLFTRVDAAQALPKLIQGLLPNEDPAVLTAVARFAEERFDQFSSAVRALPEDSERAVLALNVARHTVHPGLGDLVVHFARSGSPEVRAGVAELWQDRPDMADPVSLGALTQDPDPWIRRCSAGAALAADHYDLLDSLSRDPDPSVRREVALVLGRMAPVREPGIPILDRLAGDREMLVRAAAYVSRLLQGTALPLPPELDSQVAAEAVRESADLSSLRQTARTSSSEERRLAAATALALLQDDVAKEVARTDPAPAVRHRISGALELSVITLPKIS
jgi:hypothetical protein